MGRRRKARITSDSFMPNYLSRRLGIKRSRKRNKSDLPLGCELIVAFVVIVAVLITLYTLAKPYFFQIGIIVGVLLALVIVWRVITYKQKQKRAGKLGGKIKEALVMMDNTAKYYRDEDEANKLLVSELQHLGLPAVHESMGDTKGADAVVDDNLIEGKLEPEKGEIDRLIGQLEEYSRTSPNYKVYVVIYGRINNVHLKRINNLIDKLYHGIVFLNYLENPKRIKSPGTTHG